MAASIIAKMSVTINDSTAQTFPTMITSTNCTSFSYRRELYGYFGQQLRVVVMVVLSVVMLVVPRVLCVS